ncbi:MAG: putative integral rane protein [Candidatus Eremiobacteraeota bacterium]|jgi:hypothetical protein|nr:putative integral rane protein [Candidatus Eremiobacteraeota bacterium]
MYASSLVAHVFLTTLAFGFAIVLDFVMAAVAASRNPGTIRVVYEAVARYARLIGPLFGVGILLGFGLMHERHDSATQPWLLATYALVLLTAFFGMGVGGRRYSRVLAAARSAENTVTPELERAISGATPLAAFVMLALMLALVAVMFLKPFSGIGG